MSAQQNVTTRRVCRKTRLPDVKSARYIYSQSCKGKSFKHGRFTAAQTSSKVKFGGESYKRRENERERGNARVNQDSINFTLEGALMGIEVGVFSPEFGAVRLTNFI